MFHSQHCRRLLILAVFGWVTFATSHLPAAEPIELSDEVRQQCLEVLRTGLAGEEFWPSIHAAEALALAGYGKEVRAHLEPKLATEKDDQRRCGLCRELVRAGDRKKAAVMLKILAGKNDHGHIHAAESLYKVNQVGDGKAIRQAFKQTDNLRLQLMAAAALAKQGDQQALALLRQHLASDDLPISQLAAWVLARVGDDTDLPQLRKNAERGEDPLYRAYQEHAMAALGDKRALEILKRNLRDENAGIRTFAAVFCIEANAGALQAELTRQLKDPVLDARIRAAQALLVLALPQAKPGVQQSSANPAGRPNILLILADDLGFSDLGCYGGEIATPNLDGLASGGLRFTQFYNTARCWPTRASLLTGYYAQQVGRDSLPGVPRGQRNRPAWARLLPELLAPQGYRSYHSGKWHLDGRRIAAGFDRSYSMDDQNRFFNPTNHLLDDKPLPKVSKDEDFYATTAIAQHAIDCLADHAQHHADRPFFQYLAFTCPHFPLHAPTEDIAKYQGKYDAGWEVIRQQRWNRQQNSGLLRTPLSALETELGPPYHFPEALKTLGSGEVNRPLPWDELTARQRRFQAAKMEIHAAMVDRMDQEIGRVLDQIRNMNGLENTLVLFLSDNGASAEIMVRGDGHNGDASPGSAETYLCLGPGFSSAANTPFRRHKTWVHEGGISTPLIVHWPQGIAARGELRHAPGHVIDIVPTLLAVAGAKPPETYEGQPVPPAPGLSLLPEFAQPVTPQREPIWWLHEGNRAIRDGDWKLVAARDEPWELYDLKTDRAEAHNLAAEKPEKVAQLSQLWERRTEAYRSLVKNGR